MNLVLNEIKSDQNMPNYALYTGHLAKGVCTCHQLLKYLLSSVREQHKQIFIPAAKQLMIFYTEVGRTKMRADVHDRCFVTLHTEPDFLQLIPDDDGNKFYRLFARVMHAGYFD
jgi:hypothetical protein